MGQKTRYVYKHGSLIDYVTSIGFLINILLVRVFGLLK